MKMPISILFCGLLMASPLLADEATEIEVMEKAAAAMRAKTQAIKERLKKEAEKKKAKEKTTHREAP